MKKQKGLEFDHAASHDPAEMSSGGLVDDVSGLVVKSRYVPWTYPNSTIPPVLAVVWGIKLDGGEEDEVEKPPHYEFYNAADLGFFRPGIPPDQVLDDEEAELNWAEASEEEREGLEGTHAIPIEREDGKRRSSLSGSSKFAELVQAAKDCGVPDEITKSRDVSKFEGLRFHFNRLPMKVRAGLDGPRDGKPKMILLPTKFLGMAKEAGGKREGKKEKAGTASSPAQGSGVPEEFKEEFAAWVAELVAEKAMVPGVVKVKAVQAFKDDKEKKAWSAELLKDEEWLEEGGGGLFVYDEKSGFQAA